MAITTVNLSDTFRVFVQKVNTLSTNLGDMAILDSDFAFHGDSDVVDALNRLNIFIENIDSAIGVANGQDMTALTTTVKHTLIAAINELDSDVGPLSSLTTTDKSSIVAAISEVDSDKIGSLSALNTTEQSSVVSAMNELDRRIIDVYDSDGTLLNP